MIRRAFVVVLLGGAWIAAGQSARGETSLAARPTPADDAARAKAELTAAVANLEGFLHEGAEWKAVGWKRYLKWDDLAGIVASESPPQAEVVAAIEAKFASGANGLELPQFTSVRTALTNYAAAASAATAFTSAQVQGPGGLPNFYGFASQRLAATAFADYVDRTTPVRDCILGTDIHGVARMTGQTSLVLYDNPQMASFAVVLQGTAVSNTVGFNRGVTIHSTGLSQLYGEKPMGMTAGGLFGYAPRTTGRTSSNIYNISANCGLIERIAWRRAGQQKAEAEAIASQRAAGRLAGTMEAEAQPTIAQQNYRYFTEFVNPLQERGQFPEHLAFSSRRDRVQVEMLKTDPQRPGAPSPPPGFGAAHDLGVQAHETSIVNYGQGLLGGFELTDLRLERLLRDELKAELPEELRITQPDGTLDPEKEPWSIIFARELPVVVRFEEGGMWIALRADGFTRGEGDEPGRYRPAITELLEISAQYTIEQTPMGATLRRQDDVRVRFPNRENPDQITVRDSPTVTFIRRKFRNLFRDEFAGEGVVFRGRLERAGRLVATEVQSGGGWLTIGWDMGHAPAGAE